MLDILKSLWFSRVKKDLSVTYVYDFFLGHVTRTRVKMMKEGAKIKKKVVSTNETRKDDPSDDDDEEDEEDDKIENMIDSNEVQESIDLNHNPEHGSAMLPSPEEKQKVTIDDFDLLKVLGRGAFGKVMQVRKKDTGKIYAMKVLKKSMVYARKQVAHTNAERKILEAAQHPFLMGLKFAFQSETKLYLVMDFFKGGELFFHLQKKKRFTEDEAKVIVAEVALALGHLHSKNFIYRDLKPENILMHESGHVCLTDFGLAKELDPDQKEARTMCGTPEYLPPEVLTGKKHNRTVDWWGLGVLIYELTTGVTPFHSSTMESLVRKAEKGHVKFPKHLSEECKEIISELLQVNPKMRLGAGPADVIEIRRHKWFSSIDWDKLLRHEVSPIYLPVVDLENDAFAENFDKEFTDEPALDSVVPDNLLKNIPKDAHDFNQWSFNAESSNKLTAPEDKDKKVYKGLALRQSALLEDPENLVEDDFPASFDEKVDGILSPKKEQFS